MAADDNLNGQQFWYHVGQDPAQHTGGYVHLGAVPEVGLQRKGGQRDLYEVEVSPQKPLNTPDRPLDDTTANRLSLYAAEREFLGRDPKPEDFDPDFEDAPTYAKDYGLQPDHDAVFYLNDVETVDGRPTISAMVSRSAIKRTRKLG